GERGIGETAAPPRAATPAAATAAAMPAADPAVAAGTATVARSTSNAAVAVSNAPAVRPVPLQDLLPPKMTSSFRVNRSRSTAAARFPQRLRLSSEPKSPWAFPWRMKPTFSRAAMCPLARLSPAHDVSLADFRAGYWRTPAPKRNPRLPNLKRLPKRRRRDPLGQKF